MRKNIYIIGIALALIMGIVGWFVLPDMVVTNIGLNGNASETMPKIAAVLVFTGLAIFGGVFCLSPRTVSKLKGLVVMCAGLVAMLFVLIVNLVR